MNPDGALGNTSSTDPYAAGYGAGFTPAPSNKTITVGGGTNDWANQILNDPAFMNLKNLLSAQGISDAAHLRGAIQQALIGFGDVPNLPSDVLANTGLDTAGTAELAKNNPFSTLARLNQAYQDQQSASKNQLAARGILNSGETGYQLGRLGQQQAQNQYDVTNSLLGNIGNLNDAYVAGRQAAAQQLANGAIGAENTAAQNGGSSGGSGVTATWDPATGTYVDPTGNHYDPSGNPVSFTPPSTNQAYTPDIAPAPAGAAGVATPGVAAGSGGLRVRPF